MATNLDYKFETFQEYYGDAKQVKKTIDECEICGSKLVLSHISDYTNLIIHENARCSECGHNERKIVHIIN